MLTLYRFNGISLATIRGYSRLDLPATVFPAANIKAFDKENVVNKPTYFSTSCSRLYHVSQPMLATKTLLFNRENESDFILKLLRQETPQLSLITGPINSGKSMLMRHVIETLSNDPRRAPTILSFNMRELPFVDIETFVGSFKRNLCKWYEDLISICSIKTKYFDVHWKHNPPSLVNLLEAMAKELKDWTWLRGYQVPTPIFYIDEANLLRDLVTNNVEGQKVLKTIFMWFVAMTKEQEKFHVLLCSSDSFMHNWLSNYVGNDRFNTYAIGHLTKEEAKNFWDDRVVVRQCKIDLKFDDVYEFTGGNMFLMKRVYMDYIIGGIQPNESFFVQQATSKLTKALCPENPFIKDPLKSPPKWKEEELVTVMKKLVNSKGGYVYYNDLRKEVRQVGLESMIEYNIIHLRPYFKLFCHDLDPVPDRPEVIITAESQVGLVAMKQLLEGLK